MVCLPVMPIFSTALSYLEGIVHDIVGHFHQPGVPCQYEDVHLNTQERDVKILFSIYDDISAIMSTLKAA